MLRSADVSKHGILKHTRITNSELIGIVWLMYLAGMAQKVAQCYSNYFLVLAIMSEIANYLRILYVLKCIRWHWRYRSCLNAYVRIVALVQTMQTMPYIFNCIAIQHKSLNNLQYYLKFYHSKSV